MVTVTLKEFGGVEQARLWLEYGPEIATHTFIGYLRLARYFGNAISLDRNQVLDGIILLSLGPKRLLECLGAEPGQTNPVIIRGAAPSGDGDYEYGGTRLQQRQNAAAVFTAYQKEMVEQLGVSSAQIANEPQYIADELSWVYVDHDQALQRALRRNAVVFTQNAHYVDIATQRAEWLQAMEDGWFTLDTWAVVSSEQFSHSLKDEKVLRTITARNRDLWESFKVASDTCGTRRSAILSSLKEETSLSDAQKRILYDWWDRTLCAEIATVNGDQMIRLTPYSEEAYGSEQNLASALGLVTRPTWRQGILGALMPKLLPVSHPEVVIGGQIIETLSFISDSDYTALVAHTRSLVTSFWEKPTSKARLFDLSMATLNYEIDSQRWGRIVITLALRISLLVAALAVIAIVEMMGYTFGGMTATVSACAGFVAALPWSDIRFLFRLSPWKMHGTLRIEK
ncbi:MAG: hypothetical protein Q4C87_09115 [Actinomycetaceae bacterium]|nr:hypothetical protein [Actinomycetaceae bacterium]